jgi:hypothetical protein
MTPISIAIAGYGGVQRLHVQMKPEPEPELVWAPAAFRKRGGFSAEMIVASQRSPCQVRATYWHSRRRITDPTRGYGVRSDAREGGGTAPGRKTEARVDGTLHQRSRWSFEICDTSRRLHRS